MESDNDRRSFLGFATFGIGAIFSTIIGVPIVCYALDPRHRKGADGGLKPVEGIKLDELTLNEPKQGVLRDVRLDAWTLHPNDVIGRVWVVQVGPRPANVDNLDQAQKDGYLFVFTTICPHLGCSVNLNGEGNGFLCPCHAATFKLDGDRLTAANPALRGMDRLEWDFDESDHDRNRIKVKYENFVTSIAEKKKIG